MIKQIILTIIIMLILDSIYLYLLSPTFKKMIYNIQNSELKFRIMPALICYVALIFGLNYFILNSNKTNNQKILDAILLGLVIYTVYETTNYAVLDNWNINIAIIDSLWGGALFGLTTYIVLLF